MIQLGGVQIDLNEPAVLAAVIGLGVLALILLLLVVVLLRPARIPAPLVHQLNNLGRGQEQLRGNLQTVSDTQA